MMNVEPNPQLHKKKASYKKKNVTVAVEGQVRKPTT